jgi:hypothetical protein
MYNFTYFDEDVPTIKEITVKATVHHDPIKDGTGSDPDPDVDTSSRGERSSYSGKD